MKTKLQEIQEKRGAYTRERRKRYLRLRNTGGYRKPQQHFDMGLFKKMIDDAREKFFALPWYKRLWLRIKGRMRVLRAKFA